MQVQETPLRRITNALFKMAEATHAQRTCWPFIFKRQGYFCYPKMEVLDPSLLFFSTSQQ